MEKEMYMALPKEILVEMIIECNRIIARINPEAVVTPPMDEAETVYLQYLAIADKMNTYYYWSPERRILATEMDKLNAKFILLLSNEPIPDLPMSKRLYNCLKSEGLLNLKGINIIYKHKGMDGFRKIRNFGKKTLNDLLDSGLLNTNLIKK